MLFLILLLISVYAAWRHSKQPADMDWGYLHLEGFTGSWYGRDYPDPKSPLPHVINWITVKLVGRDVHRVKFVEHFLFGSIGAIYFLATGDFFGGLIFTVLINTPHLWVFHGNVSQFPACMIMLGFAFPQIAWIFWGLAVAYEPKLILVYITFAVIRGWWWQSAVWLGIAVLIGLGLYGFKRQWFDWIYESMVTLSFKIQKSRKNLYPVWVTWWAMQGITYIAPWIIFAVWAKQDLLFWLPVIVYLIFIAFGKVIRQNHMVIIVPWLAVAGMDFRLATLFILIDFFASGFYLGDMWERHYNVFANRLFEVKTAAEWLKNQPGTLYVSGMHVGDTHIYSEKPIQYGLGMQIEVRENSERIKGFNRRWAANPPDWIVETPEPNVIKCNTGGYQLVLKGKLVKVWKKMV